MAGEKTFSFEILTVQQLFLREQVRFVIAPGQEGLFEILPDHAPFVFALKPGPLRIHSPEGQDSYLAVGVGFLIVQKDRTTVLTRSAERPEDIDVTRAERARERAEQRLREKAEGVDVARCQASLQRALARLKVASQTAINK